jgi:hypothetical protein
MGILDDAKRIAKRVQHPCDANAAPNLGQRLVKLRPHLEQTLELFLGILDTPIDLRAMRAWLTIGNEPQFEALRIYLKLNCSFYKVGKNLQMAAVDML